MTITDITELHSRLQHIIQISNSLDRESSHDISISNSDTESLWSDFLIQAQESCNNPQVKRDFLPILIKSCILHYENTISNTIFQNLVDPWKHGSWEVLLMITAFTLNKNDVSFKEFILFKLFKSLTRSSIWIKHLWKELSNNYQDLSLKVKTLEFLVITTLSMLPTKLNSIHEPIPNIKLLWNEKKFYDRIMAPAIALLFDLLCHEYNSDNSQIIMDCIHSIWIKWSRLGHSKAFSMSLLLFRTLSSHFPINIFNQIIQPSDMTTIDFHIFSYLFSIEHIDNHNLDQLVDSMHRLHEMFKYNLFSPLNLSKSLLNNDSSNIYGLCSLFLAVFEQFSDNDLLPIILKHWGTKSHVQNDTFENMMKRAKLVIFICICYIKYQKDLNDHNISSLFMSGISNYLDSQMFKVRCIGMFIAEFYSSFTNKISFDIDLYNSPEYILLSEFEEFSRSVIKYNGTLWKPKYNDQVIDNNNDTSEDELIERFDHSTTPLLLAESIILLKSQDKDKIASALDCLVNKNQIRDASNMTLESVSRNLITTLIHLSFDEDDKSDALRTEALMKLLFRQSDICIQVLLKELWSTTVVLIQRMYILSLFSRCCKEPFNEKEFYNDVVDSLYLSIKKLDIGMNEHSHIVNINYFSQNMAHKIFYGLINPNTDCNFVNSDYYYDVFMERLLLCLALIVYHSTLSQYHKNMMYDLFYFILEDITLILKSFEIYAVRLAILKSLNLLVSLQISSSSIWSRNEDIVTWGELYAKLDKWIQSDDWDKIIMDKEQYELRMNLMSMLKNQFRSMTAEIYCLLK